MRVNLLFIFFNNNKKEKSHNKKPGSVSGSIKYSQRLHRLPLIQGSICENLCNLWLNFQTKTPAKTCIHDHTPDLFVPFIK